jgi:hypothetical protein
LIGKVYAKSCRSYSDQFIAQIQQLKPQILAYLMPSIEQDQQGQTQLRDFEHQLVQVFFDRLDRKRQNLKRLMAVFKMP